MVESIPDHPVIGAIDRKDAQKENEAEWIKKEEGMRNPWRGRDPSDRKGGREGEGIDPICRITQQIAGGGKRLALPSKDPKAFAQTSTQDISNFIYFFCPK